MNKATCPVAGHYCYFPIKCFRDKFCIPYKQELQMFQEPTLGRNTNNWRGRSIQQPPDTSERIGPMSDAAWCNINDPETNAPYQVGHAFNGNDEDREHFTKTRTVNVPTGNSYGRTTYQERQEVTESLDMCGYHALKQAGLFNKSEPAAITVESVETEIDRAEADADRANAAMWEARYDAERARRLATE